MPRRSCWPTPAPLAGSAVEHLHASWPTPISRIRRSRSSDGKTVKVDQAGYSELRTSPNREDRKAAMSAFFGALGGFSRTFGTTMNSSVQKVAVLRAGAEVRVEPRGGARTGRTSRCRSTCGWSTGVNRNLPTFHRYLRLRKRMMGITDDLHYYDLYAPLVAVGEPALHAGGGAEARARRDGAARAATTPACCSARSRSAGSTGIRPKARCRAPTRTAAPTTCTRTCC